MTDINTKEAHETMSEQEPSIVSNQKIKRNTVRTPPKWLLQFSIIKSGSNDYSTQQTLKTETFNVCILNVEQL